MRKLTEHEIAKKREIADALWLQRAAFYTDAIRKANDLKVAKRQLRDTERDFAVIQNEITTGETDEQPTLPMEG